MRDPCHLADSDGEHLEPKGKEENFPMRSPGEVDDMDVLEGRIRGRALLNASIAMMWKVPMMAPMRRFSAMEREQRRILPWV